MKKRELNLFIIVGILLVAAALAASWQFTITQKSPEVAAQKPEPKLAQPVQEPEPVQEEKPAPEVVKDGAIPAAKKAQYKAEIERTINSQFDIVKKETEDYEKEVHQNTELVIAGQYDINEYISHRYDDVLVDTSLFYLYAKLIDITKKYANLTETPATDDIGTLYEFLQPYFKDCNVNTTKLDELGEFVYQKYQAIDKYMKEMSPKIPWGG